MSENPETFNPSTTIETAGAANESLPAMTGEVPPKERTMGMAAHLAAFAMLTGIPFANILGPLVVWLVKKDTMPFVDEQGKESLNFQITLTIALLCSLLLCLVLIGLLLLPIVCIGGLIFTIIGAIKANNGEHYRYPLTLRLIK